MKRKSLIIGTNIIRISFKKITDFKAFSTKISLIGECYL